MLNQSINVVNIHIRWNFPSPLSTLFYAVVNPPSVPSCSRPLWIAAYYVLQWICSHACEIHHWFDTCILWLIRAFCGYDAVLIAVCTVYIAWFKYALALTTDVNTLDRYYIIGRMTLSQFVRIQYVVCCNIQCESKKNPPPPKGSWHFLFSSQTVENF